MQTVDNIILGVQVAFSLHNLLFCFVGVLLGTAIGVLPGLGPNATISMLLPMTFALEPTSALIMLAGIYYGAQYGGSTTAILVVAPIIAKPLMMAGVDPVHLGMVVVFNLMIGLLTPPMGLALYLVADIAGVKMKDVLREMLPFYVPLAITLLLITYVPGMTAIIPRLALGG